MIDPNKLVALVLMPLLFLNALLWCFYTHATLISVCWFAAFIMSAGLYRRVYQ